MKKTFFTLCFFFSVTIINAQFGADVVIAVTKQTIQATEDSEQILNGLKNLNENIKKSYDIQSKIKETQDEIKEIKKSEEEDLLNVPMYLKTGETINSVLDTESKMLEYFNELINIVNNSSLSNININEFVNPIMSSLSNNVDESIKICTDNVYRMTVEERKQNLKAIITDLTKLKYQLMSKISDYKNLLLYQEEEALKKQRYFEMKNKKIKINSNKL